MEARSYLAPALRIGARVGVAALTLGLAVVLGLTALLGTSAGLSLLLPLVEYGVSSALTGELTVGQLSGSAFSTLVIDAARITDDEGRPAVSLGRLEVNWAPSALLGGGIEVGYVRLVDPTIRAVSTATGGLNLARLVPPSEPDPEPEESAPLALPRFRLGSLEISGGRIDVVSDGRAVARVRDLEIALQGQGEGDGVEAQLSRLSARIQDDLPLNIEAKTRLEGDDLDIEDLRLTLGEARVDVPRFVTTLPPGPLDGRADISLPEGLLAKLGLPDLPFGARLKLRAHREADVPRWKLGLSGRLARSPLTLTATVTEGRDAQARLTVRGLDLRRLVRTLPDSQLDVAARVSGSIAEATPDLRADVDLKGWLDPSAELPRLDVRKLALDGRWRGSRVEASAEGEIDESTVRLKAALDELLGGNPRIRSSELEVEIPHLARLAGDELDGAATLTATVSGRLNRLEAAGQLRAREIRAGPTRLRSADMVWRLTGLPSLPVGQASVEARDLRLPNRRIDRVNARLEAASDDGVLDVALPQLSLTSGSATWAGTGGRLQGSQKGPVSWTGLALTGPGAKLNGEARLARPDFERADLEARVEAHVDARALPRSLIPELGDLEGDVDLEVTAERAQGATSADVDLRLADLRLDAGREPVGATAQVNLQPGALRADVEVTGLGDRVRATAQLPAPSDATRAADWKRAMGARPVKEAVIEVRSLDLGRLQRILGVEAKADGQLSLEAHVRGRGERAQVRLTARDVRPGPPLENTRGQAHLNLEFDRGHVVFGGRLAGRPFGDGTLSATVAGPRNLFAVDGWKARRPEHLRGARVDFDRLRLDALDELRLYEGISGLVDVHVYAEEGARPLAATVLAEDVRVPPLDGRWDGDLRADLVDTGSVAIDIQYDGAEALTARASVPVGLEAIVAGPQEKLQKTPVAVQAKLRFPLAAVGAAAGFADGVLQGRLTADLEADGVPGDLHARLTAGVDSLQVGSRSLSPATLSARLDGPHVGLESQLAAPGAGGLRITGSATVAAEVEGTAFDVQVDGDGLPLDFLSRFGLPVGIEGELHADLDAEARGTDIRPEGWLEARELRIVFAQPALLPLNQGKLRAEIQPRQAKLRLEAQAMGGRIEVTADGNLDDRSVGRLASFVKLRSFPVRAGQLARITMDVGAEGRVLAEDGTHLDVVIERGEVLLADESTRSLHPVSDPGEVRFVSRIDTAPPEPSPPVETSTAPSGPPIVIIVDTRQPIDVFSESKLVDARVDLDLSSRTNVEAQSGVRGRVWVPNGELDLLGRRYRIDRAEVILEGRQPPNPRLDVLLSHEFVDAGIDFFVRVRGNADKPELELSSSPARYSKNELLQILQGTDPGDLGKDGPGGEEAALGAARSAAAGFLASQVKALTKELPEFLRLDTLEADVDENNNPSLTVGKWLNRQIFLAYRYDATSDTTENQSEAIVRYRFLPGWLLELVTGDRNAWSLDLLWVRRFND